MFLTLPDNYLMLMGSIIVSGIFMLFVLLMLRRRRQQRRVSRILVNAGLSVWMVAGLLTVIELGFAGFYDTTDSFNRTNVSRRWFHRHIENSKRSLTFQSGQGIQYRAAEPFPQRPPEYHICVMGDSFTFGHGIVNVADRFSDQLESRLNKSRPGKFRVSNLSLPGTDLYWVQKLLEQLFIDDYKIDTAVYVICLNDIETFTDDHMSVYKDIGQLDPSFILFRDTYFLNLVYFRMNQFQRPEIRDYYSFVKDYYDGEPWQRMKAKLSETADLCRVNDCEFRVVIFPFLHNSGDDYPFRNAHASIVAHCDQNRIPVLDLEPLFRAHANERLTVNPFDAHPNEHAHALAARAIEEAFFAGLKIDRTPATASDE
jgi:hypothetical protein